jgi:hypothetical protein
MAKDGGAVCLSRPVEAMIAAVLLHGDRSINPRRGASVIRIEPS